MILNFLISHVLPDYYRQPVLSIPALRSNKYTPGIFAHENASSPFIVTCDNLFNNNPVQRPPDCLKKLKEALGDLAREKGVENITSFVDICTRQVAEVLRADEDSLLSQDNLTTPINPTPILRREVQLWLTGIKRRIGGGASETHITGK
jgi:hypothetical protein